MQKYIAEFLGTAAFLVSILYITEGKFKVKNVPPSVLIGAALAAIIEFNNVSGGHYNPAVSFMMFNKGVLSNKDLIRYVIAQSLGAVAALQVYSRVFKK